MPDAEPLMTTVRCRGAAPSATDQKPLAIDWSVCSQSVAWSEVAIGIESGLSLLMCGTRRGVRRRGAIEIP